jgi:hypothetical protein
VSKKELFQHAEFRELRQPALPYPRRNYEPRDRFITLFSTASDSAQSKKRKKTFALSTADLARGRAVLAKRTKNVSQRQRIADLLRDNAPRVLSSNEIAVRLQLPITQISTRVHAHIKKHGQIAASKKPRSPHRYYQWIGETT